MWLEDGVEYIYAESEAMDYGGVNEENDEEKFFEYPTGLDYKVEYDNIDSEEYDLVPETETPWDFS